MASLSLNSLGRRGYVLEASTVRVLSRDYLLPSRVAGRVQHVLHRLQLTRDLKVADNAGCIPDVCPPVGPTAQYTDLRRVSEPKSVIPGVGLKFERDTPCTP